MTRPAAPARLLENGCGGRHAWRFDRRGEAVEAPWVGCEQPSRLMCRDPTCGAVVYMRCHSSRSRACQACAGLYRGRVGIVAGSGFRASDIGLMLTVTAPGMRRHYYGGRVCPCTPAGGVNLASWNAQASSRFNRLMQELRRHLGFKVQYFKGAETQDRGALHFHFLVKHPDAGGTISLSLEYFRALAMKHGFGHEVDVQTFTPEHAAYVSKYVSKSADDRPDIPWWGWRNARATLDATTGELVPPQVRRVRSTRASYRTWSASRDFGDPMALVRRAQQHYVMVVDALPPWHDGQAPDRDRFGDVQSVPDAQRYGNPARLSPEGSPSP